MKYQNYCGTLDVYLFFAIEMGQIQLKLIYIFVTYGLASLKLQVCNLVLIQFAPAE